MAPLKTGITRALRSRVPGQSQLIQRGIAATAQTSNWTNSTTSTNRKPPSTPFPLSDFPRGTPPRNITPPQPRIAHHNTNTFTTLLNDITHSLTTTPSPHLPTLHNLLRSYTSDPSHWSKFAHANPEKQYTRNLVCEVPGIFNLLLLVWTPGKASPIHDHADAHCLMKVLRGSIRERRFATPLNPGTGPLQETSSLSFGPNKVTYMADALGLHSIENPSPTEYAVSLHLYTPPNAAMRGCHLFEVESGERRHVMQGAYDSVGGMVPPNVQ
ncbi:RmlC-like cupin domain-containing protein [Hyaloscypha finlandica]|nr:RmlC-like cupin domain-containing protein [Hyaloscypha finlandica]